jgi:hypothetical protein
MPAVVHRQEAVTADLRVPCRGGSERDQAIVVGDGFAVHARLNVATLT